MSLTAKELLCRLHAQGHIRPDEVVLLQHLLEATAFTSFGPSGPIALTLTDLAKHMRALEEGNKDKAKPAEPSPVPVPARLTAEAIRQAREKEILAPGGLLDRVLEEVAKQALQEKRPYARIPLDANNAGMWALQILSRELTALGYNGLDVSGPFHLWDCVGGDKCKCPKLIMSCYWDGSAKK